MFKTFRRIAAALEESNQIAALHMRAISAQTQLLTHLAQKLDPGPMQEKSEAAMNGAVTQIMDLLQRIGEQPVRATLNGEVIPGLSVRPRSGLVVGDAPVQQALRSTAEAE